MKMKGKIERRNEGKKENNEGKKKGRKEIR
jgi:hypothetical protein